MVLIHINNCVNDTIGYLQNVNDNLETIKNIVDVSNDTISNEISAVNTMLVVFSVIVGIIGIFLSWYISRVEKKVKTMKDSVEETEKSIKDIAHTVEETDNKIQSDISGLYEKLRKEESLALLKRLELEPQDIAHLDRLLLARPLDNEGFPILKSAFLKIQNSEEETDDLRIDSYKILFFQHYLGLSILDDDLRDVIIGFFQTCMNCAYKRDIIKSTEDFCCALSKDSVPFDKIEILTLYLKELNDSKHSNLVELKNIFQDKLKKDLLVEAIEKCTSNGHYLSLFGIEKPDNTDNDNDDIVAEMDVKKDQITKSDDAEDMTDNNK